ncbi:MAG: hypothetical protein U0Q18_00345 [Bryobacteraceae bacterium]
MMAEIVRERDLGEASLCTDKTTIAMLLDDLVVDLRRVNGKRVDW